ncbi:hypothetical protein SBV1_1140007 [Verrucomicrobia bacterium]|nr:hypothetical protein SBV1_1140007 [Verrucomicrobiota bacterium]
MQGFPCGSCYPQETTAPSHDSNLPFSGASYAKSSTYTETRNTLYNAIRPAGDSLLARRASKDRLLTGSTDDHENKKTSSRND